MPQTIKADELKKTRNRTDQKHVSDWNWTVLTIFVVSILVFLDHFFGFFFARLRIHRFMESARASKWNNNKSKKTLPATGSDRNIHRAGVWTNI